MKYLNNIRPFYFFFAFMLGILYVYLIEPGMKYINHHPAPENAGHTIYHDKNGECYVYDMEKVDCPTTTTDKSIKQQPIVVTE